MKLVFSLVLASTFAVVTPALADSDNWSEEKAAQVDQNRHANSGLGEGGERKNKNGDWVDTKLGETGFLDVDPGNSGNQCQGGKNANSGGC